MTDFKDAAGKDLSEQQHEVYRLYAEKFGPVPSGLSFDQLQSAFQPFGMASVGMYPPPAPPKEHDAYLKRVAAAGAKKAAETRKKREEEYEQKRLKAVERMRKQGTIVLVGDAHFEQDYDDIKWVVGKTDVLGLLRGAYGDLGAMRVTIEFLPTEGKATP